MSAARGRRSSLGTATVLALVLWGVPGPTSAQELPPNPVRREALTLRYPRLRFRAPTPQEHTVKGVPVLFLEDHSIPLVNVLANFKGGYGRFPRDLYAAGSALPALLRYGGTRDLAPDSVDALMEGLALQTSFGGGGGSVFSTVNTLSANLEPALKVWGAMLREPRFDTQEVSVWRGREVDAVVRRPDNPQRLAFGAFNRLLYGDHPIGWEMSEADLTPEAMTREDLRTLHSRILCRDNLILGVTGDVPWPQAEKLLEDMLDEWPRCTEELPEPPIPEIRRGGGVFVIPRPLEQSVLIMAHPTELHLGDDDYFSAQIGNTILGAGGFSSRLLARVRTEEGYAYSAGSLWTAPREYEGLVGAVTQTRPESAVPALRLILDILGEMTVAPPETLEVETAVDQIANGFVFHFETAAQIVARRISFMAQELPDDWLNRYLEGVQNVTPRSVRNVFRRYVHPSEMTILVLGDPNRMDMDGLAELGPVTFLDPDTGEILPPNAAPPR